MLRIQGSKDLFFFCFQQRTMEVSFFCSSMRNGLELWKYVPSGPFVLVDKTPEGLYEKDVELWNNSVSLNKEQRLQLKDANTAATRPNENS